LSATCVMCASKRGRRPQPEAAARWCTNGVIGLLRTSVKPFTEKQIKLVTTFADQAVIAIENTRLLNELRESLEQQTATSDVLKVISRSTFDLQTVLNTLVESAARLCRAERSAIRLAKDGLYYNVANYGFSPEHKDRMERETVKPDRSSIVGGVVLEGKSIHVVDSQADPNPDLVSRSRSRNIRTILGVPLQREGTPIGVLLLQRTVVQPFTDQEIGLAETFADQAVIAIENVRLFEAEQQRSRELSESLEQQTATSEVLRVISSSPGELEPVFQAMLENATRICEATFGSMLLREGDAYRRVALHNAPPNFEEFSNNAPILRRGMAPSVDRVIDTGQVSHVLDVATEDPNEPIAKFAGARTLLVVPMLKDNEAIGVLGIYRHEVRPFSARQIELVTNFAAQAVIAIEDTRLLNELRQSLEQQTATADVLKVISRSTFDLQAVLDTLVESVARLCDADIAVVHRQRGTNYQAVANFGGPPDFRELILRVIPFEAAKGSVLGRTVLERKPVQVADVLADPEYSLHEVQKNGRISHQPWCASAARRQSDRCHRLDAACGAAFHRQANRTRLHLCRSGGDRD
jgi:two-component system, NtrC family, sensor kinase